MLRTIAFASALALVPVGLEAQATAGSAPSFSAARASGDVAAEGSARGSGDVAWRASARASGDAAAQAAGASAAFTATASVRGDVRGATGSEGPGESARQAGSAGTGASAGAGGQQGPTPEARIKATLAAAAAAHIPTQLLESKVAEGRAKHVPEERIAAAVENRFQALTRASGALQRAGLRNVSAGELAVSADALHAGVSPDALVKLQKVAPANEREVATATLAQLVQLGYGSDVALERVTGAITQGVEALANLRAEAASALRVRGGIDIHVP